MNDEEFMDVLNNYLKMQKTFIQNPKRIKDVNTATEIACRLFPKADISIEDDPLHMGAVILTIKDCFLTVRETKKFIRMVEKANNFEVLYDADDNVKLSILFGNALIKI